MCVVLSFMFILLFSNCENETIKFVPKSNQDEALQIRLPQGIVQGRIDHTINQKMHYYAFKGIPYAVPPVGHLRFKAPIPAKKWHGVLDCSTSVVPSCIQITPAFLVDYPESEDCLYINVYTPLQVLNNISATLSVMVWIYGGGFITGSPDNIYYGPDYLLEQNVIVVQFAYRLGAFGFLSTADMESPGNYGLKDQHLALHWIKENIQYFGGNSSKITIFGESAGGAGVEYHLLNLKNKGLFHGAISQSGTALNIWAFQRYPRSIAFNLGYNTGIVTNSTKTLMAHLRSLPVEKLKSAAFKVALEQTSGIIHGIMFSPTIEPNHSDAYLTEKSHQLLLEGKFIKVPRIIGFNSGEVILPKQINATLSMLAPMLGRLWIEPKLLLPQGVVGEKAGFEVKRHYFENSKPLPNRFIEYTNDAYFYRPIVETAELMQQHTPTFFYVFSYEGDLGRSTFGYNKNDYKFVCHSEELVYIFSRKYLPEGSNVDKNVRARMVKMWTNFAKTGNPTPTKEKLLENVIWPQMGPNMTYLNIDKKLTVGNYPKEKAILFWKDIYKKYGHHPFDTY